MPPHEAGNKPVSGNVTLPTGWLCPNMGLAVSQAVAMNTSHWVAMPQYGCTKPICGDATYYWVAMPQCEAGSTMGGGLAIDSCAVPEVIGLAAASRGVAKLATGWLCPRY